MALNLAHSSELGEDLAHHREMVAAIKDRQANWGFYEREFRGLVARGEAAWGKSHLELLLHTFLLEGRGSRDSVSAPRQAPANGFNMLEIKGDMFLLTEYDEAMAHCVSEDMKMGAGIALQFRDMMSGEDMKELLSQKRKVGEVAILRPEGRESFVYNLVTKERYYQKPAYES